MAEFIDVGAISELPAGRIKLVTIGDKRLALCHSPRGFFAVDDTCPHRGGPLHEGDIVGDEIVCPWHLWGFNLATGVSDGNSEVCVTTHEVRIAGDRILVKL
jgi:nitrite reductase (NADH) small subunit